MGGKDRDWNESCQKANKLRVKTKTHIGKLGKSHGVHGAYKLSIKDSFIGLLMEGKIVYARLDGLDVPLIVSGIRGDKENIISFKGINTSEKNKPFIGKNLYIETENNSSISGLNSFDQIDSFNSFIVKDQAGNLIGEIQRIEEYPQQIMAVVSREESQILIPLVEEFITDVDIENKIIWMDLPDGILEL